MGRRRVSISKQINRVFKPSITVLGDGNTERFYIERLTTLALFPHLNLKFSMGDENAFETNLQENLHNQQNVLLILEIDNVDKKSNCYEKVAYLMKKYPNQIFYNNYAFETWLLNHVVFGKPITHSEQYNSFFKQQFNIETWSKKKTERNIQKIMEVVTGETIDVAASNILPISKNDWDNNPSSNMDAFITTLKKRHK